MEFTEAEYAKESKGWASFDNVEVELDHEPVRYDERHHSPNKPVEVVKGLAAQDELQQDAADTTYDTRFLDHSLLTEDAHEDNEKIQTKSRRPRWLMLSLVLALLMFIVLVVVLVLLFVRNDSNGDSSSPVEGPPEETDRRCNGLESNCKLRVNDLMYATVNDAMSSQPDGFLPFNHLEQLEDALEAGFRGLLLSSCECGSLGVQLCTAFCTTGYREAVPVFEAIYSFLQKNKREAIILNIEVYDNSLLTLFENVYQAVPELEDLLYSHPNIRVEWPSLGDLIDNDKRLIVFQQGDGHNCVVPGECPEGVHNTLAYMFSTPSEAAGLEGIKNYTESCSVSTGSPAKAPFFVSNHFAQGAQGLPNPNLAVPVNAEQTIRDRLDACEEMNHRKVNLLAVDFWSIGDTLQVVQGENELRAETDVRRL